MLRLGDLGQARAAFEAAKTNNPAFLPADLALADLDIGEAKFDDARTRLASILKSSPMNARAYLLLGSADERQQRLPEALQHYRRAFELNESNPVALNNLAYMLAANSTGSLDEALKMAQKAQEIAPDQPEFQDTMGWILYRKGLHTMAVKQLEKAAAKLPSAPVKLHLGLAYLKVGEQTRGQQLIAEAMHADAKLAQSPEIKQELGSHSK